MTNGTTTYQPARDMAPVIEAHFAEHLAAAARNTGKPLAPAPSAPVIERMIDVAFWASLRHEEGIPPTISMAWLPPEMSGKPIEFERRFPLAAKALTKLAPAVKRPGIQLGVWHDASGMMHIWGATRALPGICMVVEVVEPGMIVVKHRRIGGFGKFYNVVVFKGDHVKMVDERKSVQRDMPSILTSMLSFATPPSWSGSVNVLIQLALSMRAHGRGGILLVVPAETDAWKESILQPILYGVTPPFGELANLVRQDLTQTDENLWQGALHLAVDSIAGLTAVDGAVIINDRYELLGFGAKIGRAASSVPVERILLTEPIEGNVPEIAHPTLHGGTRHLSAAQFAYDQRDAVALVASQDGRFTVFTWSRREQVVHAHRVDALLL